MCTLDAWGHEYLCAILEEVAYDKYSDMSDKREAYEADIVTN